MFRGAINLYTKFNSVFDSREYLTFYPQRFFFDFVTYASPSGLQIVWPKLTDRRSEF